MKELDVMKELEQAIFNALDAREQAKGPRVGVSFNAGFDDTMFLLAYYWLLSWCDEPADGTWQWSFLPRLLAGLRDQVDMILKKYGADPAWDPDYEEMVKKFTEIW